MQSKQSKGGLAAAANATPEQRKERASIAGKASADARLRLPVVKNHKGVLSMGGFELDCIVTEDGRRGLSEITVSRLFGSKGGKQAKLKKEASERGDHLPRPEPHAGLCVLVLGCGFVSQAAFQSPDEQALDGHRLPVQIDPAARFLQDAPI